ISLRLAGFEVRDVIEWLYFSGFPKSHNVSKAFDRRAGAKREVVGEYKRPDGGMRDFSKSSEGIWSSEGSQDRTVTAPATELARKYDGWGTALKPAHEPIIVVRKPLIDVDTGRKLSVADCVEKYGTGAINIDASRIAMPDAAEYLAKQQSFDGTSKRGIANGVTMNKSQTQARKSDEYAEQTAAKGRFPANCITLDEGEFYSKYFNITPADLSKKASKKDRNSDWQGEEIDVSPSEPKHVYGDGLNSATKERKKGDRKAVEKGELPKGRSLVKNSHPTVKPTDLMAWLVRLVTPAGGTVLDPFAGSGSTLVAAKREGFGFIGVELTEEYIPIIEARTGIEADEEEAKE